MAILQAILLGIIEGLTEFLPISSTAHLIVSKEVIGYKDTAEIFTVVIQVGAIAAVVWFYRHDLIAKFRGLLLQQSTSVKFWQNLIIATTPAVLVGLIVEKYFDELAKLWVIATMFIVGGILIWLIESFHKPKPAKTLPQFDSLTPKQSFQVGLYQIIAMVPGVSRSGATIMGGLLSGLDRVTATAFSFYMSIPVIVLASSYKLFNGKEELGSVAGGGLALLAGTISAFITAFIAIGWLLRYVSKHDFKPFAYYRIALGLLILIVLAVT
jgi:undecaprenyl-diphosphatase